MADETESAVQKIARDRNGGEVTPKQLFDLIIAVNLDAEVRSDQLVGAFERHCVESTTRLDKLEGWRTNIEEECYERILKMIHAEHAQRHSAYVSSLEEKGPDTSPHRRDGDPSGADFSGQRDSQARQVWLMWLVGSKVGYAILTVLIAAVVTIVNLGLNYIWHGTPGP